MKIYFQFFLQEPLHDSMLIVPLPYYMSVPHTGSVRVLGILCWLWTAEQEHDHSRTPHRKFGYIVSSRPKIKEQARVKPYGHEFSFRFCVPCWESLIECTAIENICWSRPVTIEVREHIIQLQYSWCLI